MREDRRSHPRHDAVCRVDYADPKGRAWLGLIKNLSLDGMFVEHAPGLAIGDTVVTAFTLPGGPPFKLRAKVTRVTPEGAGLRFVGFWGREEDHYPDSLEAYCAALYKAWLSHV
jgi:hypothetical protein